VFNTEFVVPNEARNRSAFLTAEWRDVVMFNYEVDLALLSKYVPSGTELDLWAGKDLHQSGWVSLS
jgi:uncharacterized protein YqjF (DUF2071 family)